MEIEFFNVDELSELHNRHFLMYNPNHKEKDAWFWEYNNLKEALEDGVTVEELERAVEKGWLRLCEEVEAWD